MHVTSEVRPLKGNLDFAWFSVSLSRDICLGGGLSCLVRRLATLKLTRGRHHVEKPCAVEGDAQGPLLWLISAPGLRDTQLTLNEAESSRSSQSA